MTTIGYTDMGAHISVDGNYRYSLFRQWGPDKRMVAFIGLNPSTADGSLDDPTIRRCVGFAHAWGFDGLYMVNLFAYRATKPSDMLKAADPVGEGNDGILRAAERQSQLLVACWGAHGSHRGRDRAVRQMLGHRLHYLRLTRDGHPSHPLYLPASLTPQPWLPTT